MRNRPGSTSEKIFAGFLLAIALTMMWVLPQFCYDDAFITFRYSRNLVEGNGLVFNIGERVEGYTNFLWMVLMSIPILLKTDPAVFSRVLGSILFVALLFLFRVTQSRLGLTRCVLSWIPLFVLATSKNLLMAFRGGLETGLFVLLVTWGVTRCLHGPSSVRRLFLTGMILGMAALTRPEGILFCGVCLLAHVFRDRRQDGVHKSAISLASGFLLVFLPYFLWRVWYFGAVFPNTYYAKVSHDLNHLEAGVSYLIRGLTTDEILSFVFLPFLVLLKKPPKWFGTVLIIISSYLLYVVYVGGDYMEFFRFLMPIIPLATLVSFSGLIILLEQRLATISKNRQIVSVFLWILLILVIQFPRGEWKKNLDNKARFMRENIAAGKHFSSISQDNDLLCLETIGAIGYYSELNILDVHGLVDQHIARQPFHSGIKKIGHEKSDWDYILSRKPTYIYASDYVRSLNEGVRKAGLSKEYRSRRELIEVEGEEKIELAYFRRRR